MWNKQRYCWQLQNHVRIQNFPQEQLENYHDRKICVSLRGPTIWTVMPRNVWNDIVSWRTKTTQQLYKVSTQCIDDHHFKEEEMKSVGELSQVCSQIVLKRLYFARIGRLDILWSVNKIARWIQTVSSCGKYCQTMQTGTVSRLWLCGYLEDSKSTSGGTLCIFGSHTFVPTSWVCKKQTSVSHSSTESEIISLDAGLRLGCIVALDLWDLIVSNLGNTTQNRAERGDPFLNKREACSPPHTIHKRKQSQRVNNDWTILILFSQTSNLLIRKLCCLCVKTTKQWSRWLQRERSLTMRGVSRTHRVTFVQIHWHQKPTRRHTDQGKLHTWWMEAAISILPIVLKWCRKEREKMQVKSHSKIEFWRKSDTKVNLVWARKLSSIKERWDPLYTHTHQATQNGMLMRLGLRKSGNLMNWWKTDLL